MFGERTREHDFHYGDELQAWAAQGAIERLDLAFSRDDEAGQHRYVQHLLREHVDTLRTWLAQGAAIYVCGSLQGMAPGVDQVLRDVLGDPSVDAMMAEGRYRRDVY